MAAGDKAEGLHGYKAFWRGREVEVWAETSLKARDAAAARFKARRASEVTVVLCERPDGSVVSHSTASIG